MADLDEDTRVESDGEGYVARLSRDWEVWGPNGGYLSAIALRAAGAASQLPRPASFSVHYLGVAEFREVQLAVTTLRTAKRAESLRVTMTQDGKPILEALVWTIDDHMQGLEHDHFEAPKVPPPEELKAWGDLAAGGAPPSPFFRNFITKPIDHVAWPPTEPLPPKIRNWYRFQPRATFEDPYVDAARVLALVDSQQWPAACRPHAYRSIGYVAPTIDLSVNFHRSACDQDWLLCVGEAPVAHAGLVAGRASVFGRDGRIIASGGGHLLCRPIPT
jgi:acyl-CoA thioesterase II